MWVEGFSQLEHVYLNRTVTDRSKQPVYDGSRLKVDYVKVDGKWLINYITQI